VQIRSSVSLTYAQSVRADIGTIGRIQERLEDLRYYGEDGNFAEEAQRLGMNVELMTVEQGQDVIPGIGQSRAFARFLDNARRGDISEAIELDEAFVVAKVQAVQREGHTGHSMRCVRKSDPVPCCRPSGRFSPAGCAMHFSRTQI
jgi:hypothetical protein